MIRERVLLHFNPSSSAEPKEERENFGVDLQVEQQPDKQPAALYFQTSCCSTGVIAEGTACSYFQGYF